MESLCGLQSGPESLRYDQCLPPDWNLVELRVALGAQQHPYRFVICGSAAALAQAQAEPDCLGALPCGTDIAFASLTDLPDDGFYVLYPGLQVGVQTGLQTGLQTGAQPGSASSSTPQSAALRDTAGSAGA